MSNATTTQPITIHPLSVDSRDQPRVLCFGEALMHRIDRPDTENMATTPDRPGGGPASVACGVTRLGTPASFLGRIGDDPLGRQLLELFDRRQVSTPALQTDPKRPTRIARLQRKPGGDLCIDAFLGDMGQGFADSAVVPATLAESVKPLLGEACWLLVSTNALVSSPTAMALDLLLKRAKAQGLGIGLDIDWCPGCGPSGRSAAPFPAPRREGHPDPGFRRGGRGLLQQRRSSDHSRRPGQAPGRSGDGPCTGAWGVAKAPCHHPKNQAPSHPLGVREAFTAALLDGLCRQPELPNAPAPGGAGVAGPGPIENMLRFASACSTLVARTEGAIEPQPRREAVKAFLKA